ncbi:TIGR04141 family sporadically distributed protein [Streptomyces sp. NPDC054844]
MHVEVVAAESAGASEGAKQTVSHQMRRQFAAKVLKESNGKHTLPEDFTPQRVVLAILLKNGEKVTPESIFGFSQITVAQTAKALAARGVTVEVISESPAAPRGLLKTRCCPRRFPARAAHPHPGTIPTR